MQNAAQTGILGEQAAQKFLQEKGYHILAINWRHKRSEVDIIAQDQQMIVFVEVKTRSSTHYGYPEEFVDKNKIKKLREAADAYIEQMDWKGELRFDIIAIEKNNIIIHFEDAFY